MKKSLALIIALLTISTSSHALYVTEDEFSSDTGPGAGITAITTYAGLTFTSVLAFAKENIIMKATPAAALYLENKIVTEELIAGAQILLAEKKQLLGDEKVKSMLASEEITMETLALEIIGL